MNNSNTIQLRETPETFEYQSVKISKFGQSATKGSVSKSKQKSAAQRLNVRGFSVDLSTGDLRYSLNSCESMSLGRAKEISAYRITRRRSKFAGRDEFNFHPVFSDQKRD
jgi:hypothetical protein